MRKFRTLITVEAIILILLAFRLLTHHGAFIPMVVLAVVFSFLASSAKHSLRRRVFGFFAGLSWIFIVVIVLTTGYFWLLLIWPVVWGLFIYRKEERTQTYGDYQRRPSSSRPNSRNIKDVTESNDETIVAAIDGKNEVVDLADLVFHESGNELQIKKSKGNTKIIVPEDVAINLTATTIDGTIRIFDCAPIVDAVNHYYQSENYESAIKRVTLKVRVVAGNIEVVRG